jgi:hypothetical protein
MIKRVLVLVFILACASGAKSQVMITKIVGKYASQSQLGWGLFAFYDFPLFQSENQSLRVELMDFGYFPTKIDSVAVPIGYLSIKAGYKYVFSETKTGFYLEPSVGYCRVVFNDPQDFQTQTSYGDGVAAALEAGYSLEVGQRGHQINFGLKYEADIAGTDHTIASVGFRVSYQFNLFKKKDDY